MSPVLNWEVSFIVLRKVFDCVVNMPGASLITKSPILLDDLPAIKILNMFRELL